MTAGVQQRQYDDQIMTARQRSSELVSYSNMSQLVQHPSASTVQIMRGSVLLNVPMTTLTLAQDDVFVPHA
jgi:hypothetical protein